MASFSLRSQRTGLYKEFTLLEILKLLGDQVNDEIWLRGDEDVYNLSSFSEIGNTGNGNSGSTEQWMVESPSAVSGLNTFELQYLPAGVVLMVILNGIIQAEHQDYYRQGKQVQLSFRLNAQDILKFIYQCQTN